jgi:translocator protein
MDFYDSLVKPSWTPPDWAFPAVWFTLWGMQLFALVRVLARSSNASNRRLAIVMIVVQFVAAVVWQGFIFGPGHLLFAAWWLTFVLALVMVTIVVCWRADKGAGLAMMPTFVWVSIATVLGWSLYQLNPNS